MNLKPTERLKLIKKGGMRRICDLARELPVIINLSIGEPLSSEEASSRGRM